MITKWSAHSRMLLGIELRQSRNWGRLRQSWKINKEKSWVLQIQTKSTPRLLTNYGRTSKRSFRLSPEFRQCLRQLFKRMRFWRLKISKGTKQRIRLLLRKMMRWVLWWRSTSVELWWIRWWGLMVRWVRERGLTYQTGGLEVFPWIRERGSRIIPLWKCWIRGKRIWNLSKISQ